MARRSAYAEICEATGKARYRSEKHARRVRKFVADRIRIYWCVECRGYHLTNPEKS